LGGFSPIWGEMVYGGGRGNKWVAEMKIPDSWARGCLPMASLNLGEGGEGEKTRGIIRYQQEKK